MKLTRRQACLMPVAAFAQASHPPAEPFIEIWHGNAQSVGQCGDLQDDLNLMGHVEP